ncbi:MAG TPA: LUD domain-containing protein [Candidatus Sulfotelmatobacter sp.]|nr:LUD domain-containing protein [Candidatus Sulfotelmatobacter sp.]
MNNWNKLVDKKIVEETIENLKSRGIDSFFVETAIDAKEKVLELLPKDSKVLVGQSQTLNEIGITDEIENSDKYISVRKEYTGLDRQKDADKIRILRSTPDIILGSVHAVTESGEILIASNTGSQLASYVSGAGKVIWVIGLQKIVENLDSGFKRVYEYVLPLESERLKKLYGVGSNVSKLLIYNKEVVPGRVTIIFVNQSLGF